MTAQNLIRIVVAFTLVMMAGQKFIRWYLGLDRLERHLIDIAVSLRTLPTVREYDQHFDRKPPKAA